MELAAPELGEALWDLVWAGEVTNDAFAPLRSPRPAPKTAVDPPARLIPLPGGGERSCAGDGRALDLACPAVEVDSRGGDRLPAAADGSAIRPGAGR